MNRLKIILLIISFVFPLALSICLLWFKGRDLSKRTLALSFVNISFVFLYNYLCLENIKLLYSILYTLHITTLLWVMPSIYLFAKSILSDKKHFNKSLYHLLPGVIISTISAIILYFFLSPVERDTYLCYKNSNIIFASGSTYRMCFLRKVGIDLLWLQGIYYVIFFFRMHKYNRMRIWNEITNNGVFNLSWTMCFNISFIMIGIVSLFFVFFSPLNELDEFMIISIFFLATSFIWVMSVISVKRRKKLKQNEESAFKGAEILMKKLVDYMENEQVYLRSDLSLIDVSNHLGTNRTYLSKIINQQLGINFNNFVNQYRLNHINEYLQKNPQTGKEELSQIGGFGSVRSMNRSMNKK